MGLPSHYHITELHKENINEIIQMHHESLNDTEANFLSQMEESDTCSERQYRWMQRLFKRFKLESDSQEEEDVNDGMY